MMPQLASGDLQHCNRGEGVNKLNLRGVSSVLALIVALIVG